MNSRAILDGLGWDDGGSAAVEFALTLPLLLILMFSFYEAGRMYWSYTIVQNAARDAARYAARLPVTCGSGSTGSFTSSTDEENVQKLARTGTTGTADPLIPGWTTDTTVQVTINCIDNSSGTYSGIYNGNAKVPTITIAAQAPYALIFGGLLGNLTLNAVSVDNAQVWTE